MLCLDAVKHFHRIIRAQHSIVDFTVMVPAEQQ
jgi:hypothetical protein